MEKVSVSNELTVVESLHVPAADGKPAYNRVTFQEVLEETYNDAGEIVKQLLGSKGVRIMNPAKAPVAEQNVRGSIRRFDTTSYTIGDREVNHITVIAIGSEDAFELANANLKRNKASVLVSGKASVVYTPATQLQDEEA